MKTQNVSIVSIHPDSAQPLALDLKDVLLALKPCWPLWIWCVRYVDWLGEGSEAFSRDVEEAGSAGLWLTSQELYCHASGIYQTIEGEFIAFPCEVDPSAITANELNLRTFPTSRVELAIVAVDGRFFDVYAKDPEQLAALRRLGDVRDEDPSLYF
jgi:hypothetical protein